MNYTIHIHNSLKIIEIIYTGKIQKSDMGLAWRELPEMKEFTELGFQILVDYRNATFNFTTKDTTKLNEFLLSVKQFLDGKKAASITNSPYTTAISILFEELFKKDFNYAGEVFTTREAAVEYLCSD